MLKKVLAPILGPAWDRCRACAPTNVDADAARVAFFIGAKSVIDALEQAIESREVGVFNDTLETMMAEALEFEAEMLSRLRPGSDLVS